MSDLRAQRAIDVKARIKQLEFKRSDLWSVAGGSKNAANLYAAFLDGRRQPSAATRAQAALGSVDLMGRYGALLAESLVAHAIAKAHAKAITEELRALRALVRLMATQEQTA